MSLLSRASAACGWIYFGAWSLSFYPQPLLNHRRRSVVGLNFDFVLFNLTGFSCYSLFTVALYASSALQRDFRLRHGVAPADVVGLNDAIFAVHGLALCLLTALQCCLYERGRQRLGRRALAINALVWAALALSTLGALGAPGPAAGAGPRLSWLRVVECAGLGKVVASFCKYVPQAWFNMRRRSTVGWSIRLVLCDFVGSVFSLAQQVLKALVMRSMAPFTQNLAKTFLGLESLLFDSLFLLQHYVFYASSDEQKSDLPLVEEIPFVERKASFHDNSSSESHSSDLW